MITPKRLLTLTTKWLLISLLVLFATLWAVDELSFEYKVHTADSGSAFGTVTMRHVLAIELKGGKVEYALDRTQPTQAEPCVYSLFPHAGLTPCWYLTRQSRKAMPLTILFDPF
jgi:hypothetical protein